MTRHAMRLAPSAPATLADVFEALRDQLGLDRDFPPDVLEEAERAAASIAADIAAASSVAAGSVAAGSGSGSAAAPGSAVAGAASSGSGAGVLDARDVELLTIDPPGSMDLDQAVHIERDGEGFRVRYAIADVARAVAPGGPLDRETRERGTTVYGPSMRVPLHPPVLSEGVLSLLPDVDRFAYLWDVRLDARGEQTAARVDRALVRSRARFTYGEAQAELRTARPRPALALLRTVGTLRLERERERGGVSLDVPEQEARVDDDGVHLELRHVLPVESWNAQISLLTGLAAAGLMREAGVGVLRTLPTADPRDLERLRRTAQALGIDWPESLDYAGVLDTLDAGVPAHAAFLNEATTLFRGAGYLVFDAAAGAALPQDPDVVRHAAIAGEYAHVTAPLRRLVDRYGLEVCVAWCAGVDVPAWVREGLVGLPEIMAAAGQRAGAFERGCVDAVEAAVLSGREGEVFSAVVVDVNGSRGKGTVMLTEPAVRGRVSGGDVELELGARVRVRLVEASVGDRRVGFELAADDTGDDVVGDVSPSR